MDAKHHWRAVLHRYLGGRGRFTLLPLSFQAIGVMPLLAWAKAILPKPSCQSYPAKAILASAADST